MTDARLHWAATTARADVVATGLSVLCIIHCLGLPVLAVSLPVLLSWAEAEWVHQVLALLALVISVPVIWQRTHRHGMKGVASLACLGLTLLVTAAFVEPLHDVETDLTVVGALFLGMAHVTWWFRHRNQKLGALKS